MSPSHRLEIDSKGRTFRAKYTIDSEFYSTKMTLLFPRKLVPSYDHIVRITDNRNRHMPKTRKAETPGAGIGRRTEVIPLFRTRRKNSCSLQRRSTEKLPFGKIYKDQAPHSLSCHKIWVLNQLDVHGIGDILTNAANRALATTPTALRT